MEGANRQLPTGAAATGLALDRSQANAQPPSLRDQVQRADLRQPTQRQALYTAVLNAPASDLQAAGVLHDIAQAAGKSTFAHEFLQALRAHPPADPQDFTAMDARLQDTLRALGHPRLDSTGLPAFLDAVIAAASGPPQGADAGTFIDRSMAALGQAIGGLADQVLGELMQSPVLRAIDCLEPPLHAVARDAYTRELDHHRAFAEEARLRELEMTSHGIHLTRPNPLDKWRFDRALKKFQATLDRLPPDLREQHPDFDLKHRKDQRARIQAQTGGYRSWSDFTRPGVESKASGGKGGSRAYTVPGEQRPMQVKADLASGLPWQNTGQSRAKGGAHVELFGEFIGSEVGRAVAGNDRRERIARVELVHDPAQRKTRVASHYLADTLGTLDRYHNNRGGQVPEDKHARVVLGPRPAERADPRSLYLEGAAAQDVCFNLALNALLQNADVNPGNQIAQQTPGGDLRVGCIDFGKAFGVLTTGARMGGGGGAEDGETNRILDYFNRSRVLHWKPGGKKSKLWRDYAGVVPSRELTVALREIAARGTQASAGLAEPRRRLRALAAQLHEAGAKGGSAGRAARKELQAQLESLKAISENIGKPARTAIDRPMDFIDEVFENMDAWLRQGCEQMTEVAQLCEVQREIDEHLSQPGDGPMSPEQMNALRAKLPNGQDIARNWLRTDATGRPLKQATLAQYIAHRTAAFPRATAANVASPPRPESPAAEPAGRPLASILEVPSQADAPGRRIDERRVHWHDGRENDPVQSMRTAASALDAGNEEDVIRLRRLAYETGRQNPSQNLIPMSVAITRLFPLDGSTPDARLQAGKARHAIRYEFLRGVLDGLERAEDAIVNAQDLRATVRQMMSTLHAPRPLPEESKQQGSPPFVVGTPEAGRRPELQPAPVTPLGVPSQNTPKASQDDMALGRPAAHRLRTRSLPDVAAHRASPEPLLQRLERADGARADEAHANLLAAARAMQQALQGPVAGSAVAALKEFLNAPVRDSKDGLPTAPRVANRLLAFATVALEGAAASDSLWSVPVAGYLADLGPDDRQTVIDQTLREMTNARWTDRTVNHLAERIGVWLAADVTRANAYEPEALHNRGELQKTRGYPALLTALKRDDSASVKDSTVLPPWLDLD